MVTPTNIPHKSKWAGSLLSNQSVPPANNSTKEAYQVSLITYEINGTDCPVPSPERGPQYSQPGVTVVSVEGALPLHVTGDASTTVRIRIHTYQAYLWPQTSASTSKSPYSLTLNITVLK